MYNNPRTTPDPVIYLTTARPPQTARERWLAAQAARNHRRLLDMQAWRREHPDATSAELLAAVEMWEADER